MLKVKKTQTKVGKLKDRCYECNVKAIKEHSLSVLKCKRRIGDGSIEEGLNGNFTPFFVRNGNGSPLK